ncbi:MAG: DUF4115 domain-containing protein [Desulfobulbaceae bacterium]|nr:DUF4115 domain-containing protein [Desulfobulbaceae bacterium]
MSAADTENTVRSADDYGSLNNTGHRLQQKRNEKGLSIEEVSETTKISTSNLRAIEAQDYDQLPADTFVRGHITSYGNHIGLDGAHIAIDFFQERDAALSPAHRRAKKQLTGYSLSAKRLAEPAHISSATGAGLLFVVIVVSFTAFCVYTSWNPFAFLTDKTEDLQNVMAGMFHTDNTDEPETRQAETTQQNSVTETGGRTPGEEISAASTFGIQRDNTAGQTGVTYTLNVHFNKDAWIELTLDDANPVRHTFQQGESREWTAEKSLAVTFSEPDSATLHLNGKSLPFPEAEDGQATLQLPEDLPNQ